MRNQRFNVLPGSRHLTDTEGSPVFLLADTAWELIHRATREETQLYFENRAKKGFNCVYSVVLAELDGLETPNAYGEVPFVDNDIAQPNERFFAHVAWIVNEANEHGITVGLLPTWGDKFRRGSGVGPEVLNAQNVAPYTAWLSRRLADYDIIWILGGDRNPVGYEDVFQAMARGIRETAGDARPITCHCEARDIMARTSSTYFGGESWLSINMAYSGHEWAWPTYRQITQEWNREHPLPVYDGEPRYENIPLFGQPGRLHRDPDGWDGITRCDAHQVRQAAYWAVLSGACGHTYGALEIWQWHDEGRMGVTWPTTTWKTAIHFDGSYQMGLMKRFFEIVRWFELEPAQSMVTSGPQSVDAHVVAAATADGSTVVAYSPEGEAFVLDLSASVATELEIMWFDPRLGQFHRDGMRVKNSPSAVISPPSSGRRTDWVAILTSDPTVTPPAEIVLDAPRSYTSVVPRIGPSDYAVAK